MSSQFQLSVKKVLNKKSALIKKRVNSNVESVANRILRMLSNNVNYGDSYVDGEGISPEDQYPRGAVKKRLIDSWRKYKNNTLKNGSVGFIFRNDAEHSPFLIGRKISSGVSLRGSENAKFRSSKRHRITYYRGQKVSRANQLTAKKWNQFMIYSKKLLKEGALGGIATN